MVSAGRGQDRDWSYDGFEIVADGIVHGVGLVLALAGTVTIGLVLAWSGGRDTISHAVYCATLITTLTASAAYNLWPVSQVKWVLRRLDHAMIFGLIAGTYTPFLARVGTGQTDLLLAAIWAVSAAGMITKLFAVGRREWLTTSMYIALGWSGIVTIGAISQSMPTSSLVLIFVGGGLYSGGSVFHHWRSLRFQNAIWHAFVLGGAACHFAAVLVALRAVPAT